MSRLSFDFVYDFIENKSRNRTFQKYALLCSLEYFLLSKKNYTAISHLYSGLNLYDNSELLRSLHSEMSGDEVIQKIPGTALNDAGTDIRLTFSTIIYEDILKLAAEAVVEKHDRSLFEMVRYFIEGSLDEDRDPDVVFGQYYHLFLSLYDRSYPKVSYNFAKEFYDRIFNRKKPLRGKTADVSFDMMLSQATIGTEFERQHYLDRTTDDMLREIGRFLGASGPVRVYGEIRRFHPRRIDGTAGGEFLRRQAGLFDDLLTDHNFTARVFRASISEWKDRKIRAVLRDIIASYYPGALARRRREEPAGSGRPALKYFPPAPSVLSELYYLLLADSAISGISSLQDDYYRNFNFDKITDLETIKEMKKSISDMRSDLEKDSRRRAELERENAYQKKIISGMQKEDSGAFHEELSELQAENAKLRDELALLKRQLKARDDYISLLETPEEEPQKQEIDTGRLMSKKFMFVGGRPELLQSLRQQFPGAVFAENETQQLSLANVDYIVMFVKHMSHALYYKYIDSARSLGIPVIYCNVHNYDMVIQKIYDSIEN